jgi:branched-subunit amino acid ABC-type transport system permease component
MRAYMPFIVVGLTSGAVYAVASLGLVLTYRSSGVFNFAHGAVGMFATYLFYSLRQHMPTAFAVLLAVLVVAPLIGLMIDGLFRRLAGAGSMSSIVAALGLLVALQGLAVLIYGPETRRVTRFLPSTNYKLFGVFVGVDQTIVVAAAVGAGLLLVAFFRGTRLGLRTRAVVDNRALSGLVGTNAVAVTRVSWMVGAAFAATSGILFVPFVGLDSVLLTLLVVEAFGAAAVGHLISFTRTAVAAFGLGVAQGVATKVASDIGGTSLVGLPTALPFLLLFLALVLSRRPQQLQEPATRRSISNAMARTRFRFPRVAVPVTVAAFGVVGPFLNGGRIVTLTATVAMVLVFASLSLLIGLSRQLSLCHAIFVALGATTLSHLQSANVPYGIALVASALVLAPIGAALAFPAIRLSSLYLGLATFGFGILAQNLIFPTSFGFGNGARAIIHRPSFLAGDLAFFYFTLAVVAVTVAAVELLRVTRLGRILVALADSPTAVGSLGVSPLAARVVAFATSAFLAGLAGGLLGSLVQVATPSSFNFFLSLIWVAVLAAMGAQSFAGVVLAAVFFSAVPGLFTASWLTEWQPVLFGVGAIVFAQTENGLVGFFGRVPGRLTHLVRRDGWRLGSERRRERWGTLGVGGELALAPARGGDR